MEENQNSIESDQLTEIAENFDKTLTLEPSLAQNREEQVEDEDEDEDEDETEDENEEFEFSFVGGNLNSPVSAEEVFEDGQIRILSPFSGEEEPSTPSFGPPVNKLFVVSNAEDDGVAEGPYCVWKSATPEMGKKSNSTGFSKLWKVRELLARSNSDGKDAFVFLKGKNEETTSKEVEKKKRVTLEKVEVRRKGGDAVAHGGERKGKKKEKSVYEALYGGGKDKRKGGGKSYLPYRQDLVGFFTNGSGMSRNIHPY